MTRRAPASVFICHSSEDARAAASVCAALEGAGIGCWIAPRDPKPGIPYARQLVAAIDASRAVLLILSSHSNGSRAVLNEIELASNRGKIVVPFRIEDVPPSPDLEFYVRSVHWFDATAQPLERSAGELTAHLRSLLGEDIAEAARDAEPPVKAHALPVQIASFVGREHELAEIRRALDTSRLVTILGTGGVGKTRCVLRIAEEMASDAHVPVAFVELAPLGDDTLVVGDVAAKAGVTLPATGDSIAALTEALATSRLLLVLDNCEHLVDGVATLAAALLRDCPGVTILATSRQPLGIGGERTYRLPSLNDAESVRLFVDRAQAVNPEFSLASGDETVASEICRRLDGIPLAIELAAARTNVLSVRQLRDHLDARFRVLSHRRRDALPRQQTLQATIDWSYDLLDDEERALFRRCGVFTDGFSLDGAVAVCSGAPIDSALVMDLLGSLIDKSLVVADLGGTLPRYRLLESTRAYARERLERDGEAATLFQAHCDYLIALFRAAGDEYEATLSDAGVTRLAVELEDARAAFDWAIRRGDAAAAAGLFLTTRLWDHLGFHREAISRARQLAQRIGDIGRVRNLAGRIRDDEPARLARVYERLALLTSRIGDNSAATDAAVRSMAYARTSGDAEILADCLLRYGDVMAHARKFDEALEALDEAEAVAPPSPRRTLQGLHARGLIGSIAGDLETGARCFAEVLALYESKGNDFGAVTAALSLAEVDHERGETAEAVRIVNGVLPRAERLADRGIWAQLMRNLSGYLVATGDAAAARRAAAGAIEFYRAIDPESAFAAIALEHEACALALTGDLETAALLEGYVQKTLDTSGFEREHTERASHERLMALLRRGSVAPNLDELLRRGERMTANEALARAAVPEAFSERS